MTYTPSFILGKFFLEKTPLNLGSSLKQLVISVLLKGWSGTKNFLTIFPLPALLTPHPLIPFTTDKITGCTNKAAEVANKALRNLPSCFFVSSFTVSVTPLVNTPESSNDF